MFDIIKNAVCVHQAPGLKFTEVCYSGESIAQFGIDEYGRLWSWGNNYFGIGGQGNWQWDRPANVVHNRDAERILRPHLCYTNEGKLKSDFVQVQSGEGSSMALDSSGRLWGAGHTLWGYVRADHNCAVFGLPHDSGEDDQEWTTGISRDNYQQYFFNFTRAVPNMVVKDYMHNSYYTLLIGPDDRVYYLGRDDIDEISGQASGFSASEPAAITQLDFAVKKLFHNGCFNYDMAACVTEDNRVIVWGSGWYGLTDTWEVYTANAFIDITVGLPNEEIIELSISWDGVVATLLNGDVWQIDIYDSPIQWNQITELSNIKYARCSQSGRYALDNDGCLWTWDGTDYGTLLPWPLYWYPVGRADPHYRFQTLRYNRYNICWQGVDIYGRLVAWGSQSWGPHLGNGTVGNLAWLATSYSGLTQEVVGEMATSYYPQVCDYPEKELITSWLNQRPFHAAVPRKYER